MNIRPIVPCMALLVLAAGCQKQPGDPNNPATAARNPSGMDAGNGALSNADLRFTTHLAEGAEAGAQLTANAAEGGMQAGAEDAGRFDVTAKTMKAKAR